MKHPLNLISELTGETPDVSKVLELVDWIDQNFSDTNITSECDCAIVSHKGKNYSSVGTYTGGSSRIRNLRNALLNWFENTKPIIGLEGYSVDGRRGTIIDVGTCDNYEHLREFDSERTLSEIARYAKMGVMTNCFLVAFRINGKVSIWWFTPGGVQLTENKPSLPV